MEAPHAKLFVRSLTNSSARILMAFFLAGTALDVHELRDWTGMSRQTVYEGLDSLKSIGMVDRQVLGHNRFVWLPAGDLLPLFQLSKNRTSELPDVKNLDTSTLLEGGESINLTKKEDPPLLVQLSKNRTSGLPGVIEILQHSDLLFDGSLVTSRGLEDRDPLQALAWCAYAYSQKGRLTGAGGLVRNRLLNREAPPDWALDRWQETLPGDFLEALDLIEYSCEICQAKYKRMADLDAHATAAHPQTYPCSACDQIFTSQDDLDLHDEQDHAPEQIQADESVRQPIRDGSSMTAEDAWASVLRQLQLEIPRASFDAWVRGIRPVRYDRNTLTIGARNAYARDWLESRLQTTAERLLVGIMNASVSVAFVIDPEVS